MRPIATHINKIDSGRRDFRSYFSPVYLVRSWRIAGLNDEEILHNFYLYFKGMQKIIELEKKSKAYLKSYGCMIGHCMIVTDPPKDGKIHKHVFSQGIDAYIYYNTRPRDMGMGVMINSALLRRGFTCRVFKKKLPNGWIFRRNMTFWGSLKSPKDPTQSGISLNKFVEVVNNNIRRFKQKKYKKKLIITEKTG